MNKKLLTLLASMSLAFFMSACGDDNSAEPLQGPRYDGPVDDESSSSVKAKSSSSSKAKSSSSKAKSSSSEAVSSSSEEVPSSSSVKLKITYLAETPYAADLDVSGDTLFAVFQRYEVAADGFTSIFHDPGLLAMFKLSDGTLLDTIPLVTKNPMAVKVVKGNVYVGTQGEYNEAWGIDADDERGIEKVDLKNKKSELWVGGSKLGGGVYMMDINADSNKAYVAVYKAYQDVPAVEVDLASKSVKKIDGVVDASGAILYDSKMKLAYIGDRGSIDYTTFEMTPMVAYSYNGKALTALYDDEMGYQPAGIVVAGGEIFVYISDFANAGKLYWIEEDEEEGSVISDDNIPFSTDTKIVGVNGGLYVLDRKGKGSIAKVNTTAKTVAWQEALNADNPYDIVAIDDNTAWVAMYNTAEIRKISLSNGSTVSSINTKELCAKTVEVEE